MFNKFISFTFLFLFSSLSVFALPFDNRLSAEEIEKIQKEEVLIRSIDKYKNMTLNSDNPGAKKLKEIVQEHNPNYLAEIIQIRKIEGNEDLPEKLISILENVEGYSGIPYWSEHHQCYFDLYGVSLIENVEEINPQKKILNSIIDIRPFGFTRVPITIEKNDDYMLYYMTNNMDLKHKGINCVKKENMKSLILVFKDGNNWILYGIGGVKAPKIPLFEKRIETSFMNKIKTFCQFVYSKL